MREETSERVSILAARYLGFQPIQLTEICADNSGNHAHDFCNDVRTLAASCLTQDETPGPGSSTFLDRLQIERNELVGRLTKLEAFIAATPATPQTQLLTQQKKHMSEYLAVLDQRLKALGITKRSLVASAIPIGEPVEVGGFDEARDGPPAFSS